VRLVVVKCCLRCAVCRSLDEHASPAPLPVPIVRRFYASLELLFTKSIVCHFGVQPRSTRKGTGLITVTDHCCEVVWEYAFHACVGASACVWPRTQARTQTKPPWTNVESGLAMWSAYDYEFCTALSITRIVDIDRLLVNIDQSPLAKCPLPVGFLSKPVAARWVQHASKPAGLPDVTEAGENGFIIGHRCCQFGWWSLTWLL
jgi:hypothetical protein